MNWFPWFLFLLGLLLGAPLGMAIYIFINEGLKEHYKTKNKIYPVFTLGKIEEQPSRSSPSSMQGSGVPKPCCSSSRKGRLLLTMKMSSSQQVNVGVKFQDKKGNPAEPDGIPVWSADNTDVLALEPAADGRSCLVKAAGPLGVGNVTMTADGKSGDEVKEIIGTLQVEVGPGDATVVALEPGTPEEQPEVV